MTQKKLRKSSDKMSKEFKNLLKKTYLQFKDHKNPPVPLLEIKEYLELEGVNLEDNDNGEV